MPDLFDINFDNQVEDISSPDKRDINTLIVQKATGRAAQRTEDISIFMYKHGSDYIPVPGWSPAAYAIYDRIVYKKKVYENTVDGNTDEPTLTSTWLLIQDNFLGTDIRQHFDGKQLMFEFALNAWFNTSFRQPTSNEVAPDYYLPKSDIYITTNEVANPIFRVGLTEPPSSTVGVNESSEAVGNDYTFAAQYGFTINIPVGIFDTLGTTTPEKEATVREFADKYAYVGVFYDINPY